MSCAHRTIRPIAAAALLTLTSPVLGNGAVHTWVGGATNDWHTSFHWNTNQVPGTGDSVIILSGPTLGVTLSDDTALVDSIYIAGQMWLSNVGHAIRVSGPTASTRVVQSNSILQLTSGGALKAIDTDTLNLESGGELWMAGGRAEIDEEFRIIGDGLITGHGRIDVLGPQAAAFGAGAGHLEVDGGELRINMVNGGSMSLPYTMEITGADNRLRLDGPFYSGIDNVDIGGGGRMTVNENWTLDGTITVDQVGTATVDGTGRADLDGAINASSFSTLEFNGEVDFNSGGEMTLWQASQVELHDLWSVQPGHTTNIGWASRLMIDSDSSSFFGWNGDILMEGGFLEVNTSTTMDGYYQLLTGLFNNVPRLVGSSTFGFNGPVVVAADLAVFEANFDSQSGSSLNVGPGSQLDIAGTGTIRSGAIVIGSGLYRITETGTLTADLNEELGADLLNDGRLEPGQPTGRFTITGDYEQGATGTFEVEFSGAGANQADRVDVEGDVELAGALQVNLLGGYTPAYGTSFVIMTGSSINGQFDDVGDLEDIGYDILVEYFPQQVRVTFNEPNLCPSDIDGDGEVGFSDLLQVLADWGACLGCDSDFDGDNDVDFTDLLQLLADWGTC